MGDIYAGIPTTPQSVPEVGFGSKGVVRNLPPQRLPVGAVLEAKNYIPTKSGLKRRSGLRKFLSQTSIADDPPIQDIINFWAVTGAQQLLVLGQDYLYWADVATGYTKVYDAWDIGGRVSTSGAPTATVTGTRTLFTQAGVVAGDWIILDYAGTKVYRQILTVNSETQLTLTSTVPSNYTKVHFRISRLIRNADPWLTDWTIVTGGTPKVLIADATYPLRAYDGTNLTAFGTINTGTVSCPASVTVTGVGTNFINDGVEAGDLIVLDYAGATTDPEVKKITSVDSSTQLTLTGAASASHSGKTYLIIKTVSPKPVCVTYHGDRVWIGNLTEGGNQLRQRIRWTPVLDLANFAAGDYLDLPYTQGALKRLLPLGEFLVAYFDDAIFLGRRSNLTGVPYTFQRLETGGVGLLGMKAVICYLDAHFFVGQDNIYRLSSQGIEAIGDEVLKRTIRDMSPAGHWLIRGAIDHAEGRILFGFPKNGSQIEEIWGYNYKSGGWGVDPINCDALGADANFATRTWESWVTAIYSTGTVSGSISDNTLTGTGVWTAGVCAIGDTILIDIDGDGNYEYSSTVASRTDDTHLETVLVFPSNFAGCSYRLIKSTATWESGDIDKYATWEAALGSGQTKKNVTLGIGGDLWQYVPGTGDDDGSAISCFVETGDYDLQLPNVEKTYLGLSLKLEEWNLLTTNMDFLVEGSTDRGQHWKRLGTIRIRPNTDESFVTFRLRGSMARFRITHLSTATPFVINELVLDVRVVGVEVPGRGDET